MHRQRAPRAILTGAFFFSDDGVEVERNPVGVGFHPHRKSAAIAGLPVPNIESSATPFRRRALGIPPRASAASVVSAAPRDALAGTYDERWRHERAPYLPADFDCAASSVRRSISGFRYFAGGERIRWREYGGFWKWSTT